MAEDCDNPVADTGEKQQVPWSDPAETCQVGIPDNTAEVVYVNGLPVFGLAPGIGSVDPGSGAGCPETPEPAVAFATDAENIGSGVGLYSGILNGILQFFSLVGIGGVTVEQNGDVIEIGLDGDVGGTPAWDDITGKPATFAPSAHTHPQSEVDDLESDLLTIAGSIASITATLLTLDAMAFEADDPNDGQEYVRKNNAWAVASVSGGDVATDSIWDAVGDLAVGTGANTAAKLTMGSALQVLRVNAGGTALEYATPSGGSGSLTIARWTALDNQPPAANFATLDTRNSIAVLDFDASTDESAVFVGIMPEGAVITGGVSVIIKWMATSATSGAVIWEASLERCNTDLDAGSFDTIAFASGNANGTSGIPTSTTISLTTIDSVAAGDLFRLRISRDANGTNGTDNATGDAELIAVELRGVA